jgi:hypothetical protein
MPSLYYLNEKQRLFKHFDLQSKQILTHRIEGAHPLIPLFAGLACVNNRTFIFGGKEPDSRLITAKSYELLWENETV